MPRRAPSAPPTSSTENVWPVIGTGEPGTGIEMFAESAIRSAPATIRETCRARVLIRSPTVIGTRKSPIVMPRSAAGSRFRRLAWLTTPGV